MVITTWNMQGAFDSQNENKWSNEVLALMNSSDICLLQESGERPLSCQDDPLPPPIPIDCTFSLWNRKYLFHYRFSGPHGGTRCSMAIVSKARPTELYKGESDHRSIIGVNINGTLYFCIHAISPGGADVQLLLTLAASKAGNTSWVCGGDFNREPTGLPIMPGLIVCPPNGCTHPKVNPDKKLDYLVKSTGGAVVGICQDIFDSDHYPVKYTLV